ncbi:bifunctional DNA-formamidopyrimidine glycosylase/DNA-(apurinic or apyrimidinic site) lyase [Phaeovulum vinaykumarii]|uniref:Formamidopyrimidine-DNA glycosylase n=1 Tax=Phaeovulum vinaykumarii TaxID=407234 RepID=A0A1N7M947_9RHOB|nr:bifunctional DNA-formamidopyrimidine glycosylase/DNA-(apurinic or apyrimidinic site) lyase [Phaeovulum vinaykumarii]SIS82618.1 DNA-(apurinic or apyrimidinic site) lyase [Phaeovulum vinaykumarii]SOC10822.1 DNA-(apurinic or apyrimidinic site) lyase [Phaeovulum vinaykumarii]
MPELPEVETVRRGLEPVLDGAVIQRAELRRPDLRWPFPPDMAARLTGARILGLRRRSKYILADLDRAETLLIHLGMSGRMLISLPEGATMPGVFHHPQAAPGKHDHVILTTAAGAVVTFNDPRRFGAMDLVATDAAEGHPLLAGLGPEPLGNGFDAAYLAALLAGRKTPIKAALLDQRIVAGLGNIYVAEALHQAGIDPRRAAGRIARARLEDLVTAIRATLLRAIAAGGSSLRDHRRPDGELGYFQHDFRVYGREGAPCLRDGCPGTIRRVIQSGRSSFFCPACQR